MTRYLFMDAINYSLRIIAVSFLFFAFSGCPAVWAEEMELPCGETVISRNPEAFKMRGNHKELGRIGLVDIAGMPFKKALRIETLKQAPEEWDIQVNTKNLIPLKRGDVLLVSFYARTLKTENESGAGQASFLFERSSSPWTKSIIIPYAFASEWGRYSIPFKVNEWAQETYPAGTASMAFNVGFKPQVIEIADIKCEIFRDDTVFSRLLRSEPYSSYKGRDPGAVWREKAQARIEKIRKSDITVKVSDESGNPVEGAVISLSMKRHSFVFGSCISAHYMEQNPGTTEDGRRYRQELRTLFNQVVFESGMKWLNWVNSRKRTMETVKWAEENGLSVRGHNLVWPSWKMTPFRNDLQKIEYFKKNPEALQKEILEHIKEETLSLKDVVVEWDVINEPYTNNELIKLLGENAMIDWLKESKRNVPDAKAMINDFGILASANRTDSIRQQYYEDLVKFFLKNGAPLEGIGMQSHFRGNIVTEPENLLQILDRFGQFKLPVVITEYDFTTNNEDLQADYMRDFMTAIFSHPAVSGFLMWGFWDGRHWTNNAPIYRKDWSLKPSGEVYKDLVFKKWWTSESGKTGSDGRFTARGFLGDYELAVSKNGKTKKLDFSLFRDGKMLCVKF